MRIVSLVPSLTETVVDFGLAEALVGRTRWCTEPAPVVEGIEAVGGTKNPDVARIVALRPDLVLVNKEENRIEDCRAMEAAGLRLHVTHPCTVDEAASMLEELGAAVGVADRGRTLAASCREALASARIAGAGRSRPRVFCPIWRRPWMTFLRRTYIGDMLECCGGDNVFGACGDRDFLEVTIEDVRAAAPDLVVLPDEPFAFEEKHADELRAEGLSAARFVLVDGKDLAWYGPRIPAALGRLARQLGMLD